MIFANTISRNKDRTEITEERVHTLNRKMDSSIKAIFVYGDDVKNTYSTNSIVPGKEFSSIQIVKQEIAEIKRNATGSNDKDGKKYDTDDYMVCTFYLSEMEALVCREGVYRWVYDKEDFQFVGTIDKVLPQRTVTFMERTQIKLDEFLFEFEKDACFYLDGEYITYDSGGKPIVMLVVQNEFTNPIAIPVNEEFMEVGSRDLITLKG